MKRSLQLVTVGIVMLFASAAFGQNPCDPPEMPEMPPLPWTQAQYDVRMEAHTDREQDFTFSQMDMHIYQEYAEQAGNATLIAELQCLVLGATPAQTGPIDLIHNDAKLREVDGKIDTLKGDICGQDGDQNVINGDAQWELGNYVVAVSLYQDAIADYDEGISLHYPNASPAFEAAIEVFEDAQALFEYLALTLMTI